MRLILLALLSMLVLMPASADAAGREDRRSQATSRSQPAKAAVTPSAGNRANAQRARGTSAQQASRPANTRQPSARAAAARGSRQATLRPGDVRTQRQGLVVRGAAAATITRSAATCTRRNGRTVCSGRGDGALAGWQSGLPRADYAQSDCPAGTLATLARGHEDVVRCMPL